MGEMADMTLQWDEVVLGYGQMDDGGGNYERSITYKICKYCGEECLHWERLNGNWRLFDENRKLHVCKKENK